MKRSLQKLDFWVDVDLFMTDSARLADLVLPANTSYERTGLKIYPSHYALWSEPVIEPLGESRSDVEIIIELAKRLNPQDTLIAEGQEACLDWMFKPAGISMAAIKDLSGGGFIADGCKPPYEKYKTAGFPTRSGKMELCSSLLEEHGFDALPVYREPLHSPISTPEIADKYPLVLTTGARVPELMHSRLYRLKSVRRARPTPVVDISPEDAKARGIGAGDWVSLATPRGAIRVRANPSEYVPRGVVNIYHGDPDGDVNELIDPDYRDPVSGYPGFKSMLCEVRRVDQEAGR